MQYAPRDSRRRSRERCAKVAAATLLPKQPWVWIPQPLPPLHASRSVSNGLLVTPRMSADVDFEAPDDPGIVPVAKVALQPDQASVVRRKPLRPDLQRRVDRR